MDSLARRIWKGRNGYFFIAPLVIGLIVFCYFPPIIGVYRSFFKWSGTGEAVFIGIENFKRLFADEVFLNSIPTMFLIMIPRLLIGIVVPLIMAELIFSVKSDRMQNMYRVMILLPIVAPGIIGQLIWKNIYEPTTGLMTTLVRALHIVPQDAIISWLNDPKTVIFSIIFMGFPWIGGTSVLIYMSGLMNISGEVIEASRLDGANTLQRILRIDIPMLMGQVRYFLVFGIIGGMQDYGTQIVLTKGGPGYATYVPGYYLYNQAFTAGNMGYACAVGTVLFLVIMLLSAFVFRFSFGGRER